MAETMEAVSTALTSMLSMGTSVFTWAVSTFPINIAVAGGVVSIVLGIARHAKSAVR